MEEITQRSSVRRVRAALEASSLAGDIVALGDSTRTVRDAAAALGVEPGQIAASLVFRLPDDAPLLVVTSGRHRVDVERVAAALGVTHLDRADADYVKAHSGFSIGGVSPVGWDVPAGESAPTVLVDRALADYPVVWAAAGHPHAVFPTTFDELVRTCDARVVVVADD